MKVFEYRNEQGALVSFEVRSLWPRWVAYRAIKAIPNVKVIRPLRHFVADNQDVFCVFKVGSTVLEIEEPWGDNSRYVVASSPAAPSQELELVKQHFHSYLPWSLSTSNG